MEYTIGAKEFNAVMACAAINDVRYYLNTFCIDADNSRLVATNGHVMGEAGVSNDNGDISTAGQHNNFSGYLFRALTKPLPKSAEVVVIDTDMARAEIFGAKYKGPAYIALEPIDAMFPKYGRVTARDLEPGDGISEIALAPVYLYRPVQWAGMGNGDLAEAMLVFGEDDLAALKFTIHGIDATFTLRPVRI